MIIDSPIISGSYLSTGSLSQTGNVSITGSLTATAGITGSFSGSGADLFGIPATGITGLNLSQISSGSVSASISPSQGLLINTSVSASNFTGSFTGSLTGIATSASYAAFALTSSYSLGGSGFPFSGSAVITGSLLVSQSLVDFSKSAGVTGSFTGSLFGTSSYASSADIATRVFTPGGTATQFLYQSAGGAGSTTTSTGNVTYDSANTSLNATNVGVASTGTFSSTLDRTNNISMHDGSFGIIKIRNNNVDKITINRNTFGGEILLSGSIVISGSLAVTNLSGSGVRYVIADQNGVVSAQTASAAIFTTQQVVSTAGQTTFPITNGYATGYVTVFVNGTKLSADEYVDTSGTNIVFLTGSSAGDNVEFQKYLPAAGVSNNTLRSTNYFTATTGQTNFSVNYTPGLIDIFYNGAKLDNTEYTAANGTSITLATASAAGDRLEVDVYSYQVGAFSGIGGTGAANQLAYFNTSNSITGSNAFTVSGSAIIITGSLIVSGSGTLINIGPTVFSGSVTSTAGFSGSFSGNADNATTASYAYTASSATNAFNSISASYAYTASSAINAFSASKAISSSYSDTSSYANNFTVMGNLTVYGTQSVQYITSSQLNISSNIITVNVGTPAIRFGGISVYDSGSTAGATGSLFWDSQNNNWVYQQVTGSTYTGGMLISGPRNTGGLGNEQGTTSGSLMKGMGGDHITSSAIFEDGYKATIYTNALVVSSSGFVGIGTTNPTGSLDVSGSVYIRSTSGGVLYIPRMADQSRGLSIGEQTALGSKSAVIRTAGGVSEHLFLDPGFNNSNVAGNIALAYANTGSVGIGTYLPGAKLEVASSRNSTLLRLTATSGENWDFKNTNTVGSTDVLSIGAAGATVNLSLKDDGSVGIGTTSPTSILHVKGTGTYDYIAISNGSTSGGGGILTYQNATASSWFGNSGGWEGGTSNDTGIGSYAGGIRFYTNGGTEKMRITSGGNVLLQSGGTLGINTSDGSDNSYLSLAGSGDAGDNRGARIYLSGNERSVDAGNVVIAAGNVTSGTGAPGTIVLRVANDLEKVRLTNEGFFKISNTGVYNTAQSYHEIRSSGADWTCTIHNVNSSSPNGIAITYTTASPNGSSNQFLYCNDSTTVRALIKSNGGINNYQANDTNLSDERTKKDIAPLESYWNKFKDIEIVKFKYKDQTHDDFNIGVIAQQVEEIAPEFVDVDGWGETPEDGIPLKSIYTADLNHTTIKVLQEAMAKIEELQEKLQRNNIN